jgi:TATA-binding protein-associated factor
VYIYRDEIKTDSAGSTIETADAKMKETPMLGQDVIDNLTSLRLVAPYLDARLRPQLMTLLHPIVLALQSSFPLIRNTAARCLAALCDVELSEAMRMVVESVVPLVGDAKRVDARRGAVEAVHRALREGPADDRYR